MSDIFDYLHWRGDLRFAQDNFNALDALILSRLSYLPFEDVVPKSFCHSVSLSFVARAFSPLDSRDDVLWKKDPDLLKAAAATPRFADVRLSGYLSERDYERKMQFSAVVFELNEQTRFIAFRGTDASFIGWEEDFRMFISPTLPSQQHALRYFVAAAQFSDCRFLLGGHSKGGNLALYTAINCEPSLNKRIDGIYNFDGPGFNGDVIQSAAFGEVKDRLHSFVPQSSVFGMMLEHDEDFAIVKSRSKSFMQHDIYSWEIDINDFVYLDNRTNSGYFIEHTLGDFLERLSDIEKENFTKAFFSVLESTDNTDFRKMIKSPVSGSAAMLRGLKHLDKTKRSALGRAIVQALKSAKHNLAYLKSSNNK